MAFTWIWSVFIIFGHMLFAELNTVDFIDPLHNQIELANHSQ